MTPEEFSSQAREALEQTLNQLQTAALLVEQLERQLDITGRATQALGLLIEDYAIEQSRSGNQESDPFSNRPSDPSAD